jgi:hypothetical protein
MKKNILKSITSGFCHRYSSPKLRIRFVDGGKVRKSVERRFMIGGHDKLYKKIPKREIWIDKALSMRKRADIILHELHERNIMAKRHLSYKKAHRLANSMESRYRKDRPALHGKIRELLKISRKL